MPNFQLVVIIPCYNEYERLDVLKYSSFLKDYPDTFICFVNDASSDKTGVKLKTLKNAFQNQVEVIQNSKNAGKAASVRKGILTCAELNLANNYAYLDADLAVSLEECQSYLRFLDDKKDFVFASRILKIGSTIERKFSRFLFGRIIATFISNILDIKVYDTQCGCKVFKSSLAEILFNDPFISKWLFDVELFSRMLCEFGQKEALEKMYEVPVKRWIDQGGSKVKLTYAFRLWYDLYLIHRSHNKNYNF